MFIIHSSPKIMYSKITWEGWGNILSVTVPSARDQKMMYGFFILLTTTKDGRKKLPSHKTRKKKKKTEP
jgi:hypothetical protein